MDLIQFDCANCGAALPVHEDDASVACGHCGARFSVQHRGRTLALKRIARQVESIESHTKRGADAASVLALREQVRSLKANLTRLETEYERAGRERRREHVDADDHPFLFWAVCCGGPVLLVGALLNFGFWFYTIGFGMAFVIAVLLSLGDSPPQENSPPSESAEEA
ncbi:MAG: hypothetical protein HOI95_17315 [Chromatiales bacterium]|jgi:DNA-directed RNA polymerase subunit RPC12/RpoP|nr:hypothetical protein [Chromatiales bacterium]